MHVLLSDDDRKRLELFIYIMVIIHGYIIALEQELQLQKDEISLQPRSQGFSLLNWVGRPNSKGKSPGNEVDLFGAPTLVFRSPVDQNSINLIHEQRQI